jgi:hypothetical protein
MGFDNGARDEDGAEGSTRSKYVSITGGTRGIFQVILPRATRSFSFAS